MNLHYEHCKNATKTLASYMNIDLAGAVVSTYMSIKEIIDYFRPNHNCEIEDIAENTRGIVDAKGEHNA